jgi:hypothetical protein
MSDARAKLTTAGRLLDAIVDSGAIDLAYLAHRLNVPKRRLEECRTGGAALELEVQIRLAPMVMLLAPQHQRLARRLHSQAQSALRVREGAVQAHTTYYPLRSLRKS